MGILNAAFAPLIVLYLVMYSFFRYFDVSALNLSLLNLIFTFNFRSITRTRPL
jgi:hypothetical protein